jgi:hypothetical protein
MVLLFFCPFWGKSNKSGDSMPRSIFAFALLFLLASPLGFGRDLQPVPPTVPPIEPPPHEIPPPPPLVGNLCAGVFQGSYFGTPEILVFKIEAAGPDGDLHVESWWRGGYWRGQGHCWQRSPESASIELYFPGAPVHRGAIQTSGQYVVMDGQIDGGYSFRLFRQQ